MAKPSLSHQRRARATFRRRAGGALIVVSTACALTLAGTAAAFATPFFNSPNESSPGEMLTLETSPWINPSAAQSLTDPQTPLMLSPGEVGYWQIRASQTDTSAPAALSVELIREGQLAAHPHGLEVFFEQCLTEWTGLQARAPVCADPGGSLLLSPTVGSDSAYLLALAADSPQYLLVTAWIEDTAATRADPALWTLTGTIGVGVTASGDGPLAPGQGEDALAATGANAARVLPLLGVALAMVGVGVGLRLRRPPSPDEVGL